ncbi:hypothetical protein K353_05960 [Kitasatospora sp. SolWspMP-SS2h]|uniref:DUF1684 domain-containing protein n=1 Tax=Kitasatospora sp. SolWspMP-SS2h TaxID=1305729 RepID=UPI000DBA49AC|nr:DUF1684 domain-containing protein [Kitasatospora sp. SolWspMP-SS2h]RAJ32083.1 hypothetical protein K353_05960 [Kitasatospora sp. SolWspMP-SS2h]
MTDTAAEAWQRWTEARSAAAGAPHGPLALTGTHWLEPVPAEVPGLPGRWWAEGGAVCAELRAGDGVRVEGEERESTGRVALRPDTDRRPQTAVLDELRLVPIEREGELALRVFDPAAPARAGFAGIAVYPYAPDWAVPAVFTPFEDGAQALLVENADGRARPLTVTGRVAFTLAGRPHTLTVSGSEGAGGRLSGVIADRTSGRETYRFRFVSLPAPDAQGRTVLDFNRAFLPPCAFADHFICPFPPPGNRLAVAVEAGERQVVTV